MSNNQSAALTITQPVVFLPGTQCDERIFQACWQHLEMPQRAFVPLQWAENLAHMLMLCSDRMGYFSQPIHLVGFSMGGYVAALSALQQPAKVASLTLIGSTCDALPERELLQRKQLSQLIKSKQYKGTSEQRLMQFFHSTNKQNAGFLALVKNMHNDLGAGVLAAQMDATNQRKNLQAKLAQSKFPVHLISGEQDCLIDNQTALQRVSNINMCIVKNAGHMLPIEQPLQLAQFLAQKID